MAIPQKLVSYSAMLRHWGGIAAGSSYWHMPQAAGTEFLPGQLAGYFNDFTSKTNWNGDTDSHGLPLVRIAGRLQHYPTVLFQKALGHWDRWLTSGREDRSHYGSVIAIANWAVRSQELHGGWPVPSLDPDLISPYSAMVQGQAISLLVRVHAATSEVSYIDAAQRAASLMLTPITEMGTARATPEGIVLEEYPYAQPRTVLNGWIFALFGLYDLVLVRNDPRLSSALESTLDALLANLSGYDAHYWSFYDSGGNLASPFYHRLHIAQLRALRETFAKCAKPSGDMAERFERYQQSKVSQFRALVVKTCQKLRHPSKTIIE